MTAGAIGHAFESRGTVTAGGPVFDGHLMLVPSERVALCKAIEDEIRQRAKERQRQAGEQYGRGKGKLREGLPEAITGRSLDQVAEIVGTA